MPIVRNEIGRPSKWEVCAATKHYPIFVVAILILNSARALSAGAMAEGIAPGGPQVAYSDGISVNNQDAGVAQQNAVAECKKYGDARSQAQCHVVATFSNKCAAVVQDPKGGTPGVGWAVDDTQQAAVAQAVIRCQSTAGPDRQSFCTDIVYRCDGTAK